MDDLIRDNRMRSKYVGSGLVFVKGQPSAECADNQKLGGNEHRAKIVEVITHFVICLLACEVNDEACWRLDVGEEHGAEFVVRIDELDYKRRESVESIAPNKLGDGILGKGP
jgi:hypothetical protein